MTVLLLGGTSAVGVVPDVVVEVLCYTGAVWSVHANGMDFIEKGDCAVFFGEVADLGDGGNGSAHAIHGLKSNDFGLLGWKRAELRFKIGKIVVLEDHFLCTGVADALDHGGVVHAVAENDAVWNLGAEGGQGSIIGDVAGREDEGTVLPVEISQSLLECDSMLVVPGDVSSSTCTSAVLFKGGMHSVEYVLIAAHAEVVIGTPDSDSLMLLCHVRARELLSQSVDVVEVAV